MLEDLTCHLVPLCTSIVMGPQEIKECQVILLTSKRHDRSSSYDITRMVRMLNVCSIPFYHLQQPTAKVHFLLKKKRVCKADAYMFFHVEHGEIATEHLYALMSLFDYLLYIQKYVFSNCGQGSQ